VLSETLTEFIGSDLQNCCPFGGLIDFRPTPNNPRRKDEKKNRCT
jgi:hypothetical protein